MRYVPIDCVEQGMVLAKTLYGEMGELLLREGTTILDSYITKMRKLGYSGIYINDSISEDINVEDIISEELKMQTIRQVKNFMVLNNGNSKGHQKSFEDLEELMTQMVDEISSNKELIVNMIDLKVASNYTFYHSVNVCVLSLVLGAAMGLKKDELYLLGMSSLLHDMGKIFTPDFILNKPSKLTSDEYEIIKRHPEDGYNYVKKNLDVHTKVYVGIHDHHERFDGSGYPSQKSGKDISLFGRIISVTDVYDALTSDRPYRRGVLPSEGMEYIMGAGGSIFDLDIVKTFSHKIAPYPVGTCVNLSDGSKAIVVENYPHFCLRPLVKVIYENGENIEPYLVNLRDSRYDLIISGVMNALSLD